MSFIVCGNIKKWRRKWDSNPCADILDLLVFETNPFSLLGIPSQQVYYSENQYNCVLFCKKGRLIRSLRYQTIPCAIIASATFRKPAIFDPTTKSSFKPYSIAVLAQFV